MASGLPFYGEILMILLRCKKRLTNGFQPSAPVPRNSRSGSRLRGVPASGRILPTRSDVKWLTPTVRIAFDAQTASGCGRLWKLVDRNAFVGRMRLGEIPRAKHNGRDSGRRKESGVGSGDVALGLLWCDRWEYNGKRLWARLRGVDLSPGIGPSGLRVFGCDHRAKRQVSGVLA